MQFVINTSLQILIEQGLEFFILLVEESGFFDEVLSVNQKSVVFGEGFVKSLPCAKLLIIKNCCHLLPEDSLLSLDSLLLLFL